MVLQIYITHIRQIRHLRKICKENLGNSLQQSVIDKFGKIICNINSYHEGFNFLELPSIWDSIWMDICIHKWHDLNHKTKQIRTHNELKNINKYINERAEIIQSNQKVMLNSPVRNSAY
jgi:hypothetical protein